MTAGRGVARVVVKKKISRAKGRGCKTRAQGLCNVAALKIVSSLANYIVSRDYLGLREQSHLEESRCLSGPAVTVTFICQIERFNI